MVVFLRMKDKFSRNIRPAQLVGFNQVRLGGFVCLFSHVWGIGLLGTWYDPVQLCSGIVWHSWNHQIVLRIHGAIVHSCFAVSYQTFQLHTFVSCTSWPQNKFPPEKKGNVSRNIYLQFHGYLHDSICNMYMIIEYIYIYMHVFIIITWPPVHHLS